MTNRYLRTHQVTRREDVIAFFDQSADKYRESHGSELQLLAYRLAVVTSLLGEIPKGATLLEIACGTGVHLTALADRFALSLGTDFSKNMIDKARDNLVGNPNPANIQFLVDRAEELVSITDDSIDIVLCVGALEHMLEKKSVFSEVRRVLKTRGAFICLTPNGDYIWYRVIAPFLGYSVKHLSTDQFLTRDELSTLVNDSGLKLECMREWRFIPAGDMPRWLARCLFILDFFGRVFSFATFRGGVCFKAKKAS